MTLYCLKLRPRSPWRTPWQADTLLGALCATCARTLGADFLRSRLLDPMLAGFPPFVLSDACPGDLLPAPFFLRTRPWPDGHWNAVKRARWITPTAFQRLRSGELMDSAELAAELRSDDHVFLTHARHHNTLSRLTDTTGDADSGLAPFNRPDFHLRTHIAPGKPNALLGGADYLSLYVRTESAETLDLLLSLLHSLAEVGFGADVATGRGQFDVAEEPQPVRLLDAPPDGSNALVCLSTFQPGTADPTEGVWDAFPKFGRLAADFGLPDRQTHKRTLILFRPGACFQVSPPRPWLGRAVPMTELLPPEAAQILEARGIRVIHPAFGLAVSASIPRELDA